MSVRTLNRMRERVRQRQYLMTLHAEEEMDNDGLTIYDVESVVLTGNIIEQQRDRRSKERKYLVRGETVNAKASAVVVTRFSPTDTLIILTVYVE